MTAAQTPHTTAPRSTLAQVPPGPLRYHVVRLVLKVVTSAYTSVRVTDPERIPAQGPYIICFNHPSWLDPIFIAGHWPDRRRQVYVFGPRERDMRHGVRNRLITWTRRAVPFKPGAKDIVDTTRRAVAVLRSGGCLAIAGEGRLSDHAGEALPLQTGLAHFARLAGVPILPVAVIGSRWVHFRSRVVLAVGEAVAPAESMGGKAAAAAMADVVQARLQALLEGVEDGEPPGWLGRTISEAFNERPWLDEVDAVDEAVPDEPPVG